MLVHYIAHIYCAAISCTAQLQRLYTAFWLMLPPFSPSLPLSSSFSLLSRVFLVAVSSTKRSVLPTYLLQATLLLLAYTMGSSLNFADLSVVTQKRDRSKKIQAIRYVMILKMLLLLTRSFRFSPNGKLLAVGSDDACVDIYSLESLDKRGTSRTSYIPSYVTHIDWCKDSRYLQVGGVCGVGVNMCWCKQCCCYWLALTNKRKHQSGYGEAEESWNNSR